MSKSPAKIAKPNTSSDVVYTTEHWSLIRKLRQKTLSLISPLEAVGIAAIVHGSVARGDVHKNSDIDVFIANPPSSFRIETVLERAQITVASRHVIQATPAYAMKGYIEIDPTTTVSFPLMVLRRAEREFYEFSGKATHIHLRGEVRVAGVDKRLMFIEPTNTGHVESSILGKEDATAKKLGIAVETVLDRVRALTRRDAVGRTGVFLKRELSSNETFELAMKKLAAENPAVRRRIRS